MKTRFEDEQLKDKISLLIDDIDSKFMRDAYKCSKEFLFDVKKIRYVLRSEHPEIEARDMDLYVQKVRENCKEMDLCPFCVLNYLDRSIGSIEPCPWGHRLVLVDISRGIHFKLEKINKERSKNLPPVFPAKIIRYDWRNRSMTVRHFESLMR